MINLNMDKKSFCPPDLTTIPDSNINIREISIEISAIPKM